uniref:Rap guanine nucleotide exchange factor 1 n=1 Tax=Ascaris suum TaxID=6253 RepID=F1KVW1_ASCSU
MNIQFADKHIFYRWTVGDDNAELEMRATNDHLASLENPLPSLPCAPHLSDVASAVFFLSTIGPDALFRMILTKPSSERTAEELELVYEELLHVKALAHLSTMVKRELASVVFFEQHQHAGTVLFRQGDEGNSWYIILKGSVHVSIHGKGIVCTLQEGDDFGKLALVNDAPRAATIALSEDNSQFLRVDKTDFNRILRDVEANTVRLKEHGHDVLVLEKINTTYGREAMIDPYTGEPLAPRQHCCYSVMAGLPEKMVEYLLETRIDAHVEDGYVDTFFEDFVLTHMIYMPPNILCNYLKNYYMRGSTVRPDNGRPLDDVELRIGAKKRVVVFLGLWVHTLGIHFFLDPVSNSFVEELYCCVLEDSRQLPGMLPILERMTAIRQLRENAMRTLNRHPAVVLDCGVYCAHAPAPNPALPFDTCNQVICLSDTSPFTMSIRLDKNAAEICHLAKIKVHYGGPNDEFKLVEVKSNGERVVFSPTDVSIPTMISLNGRLYIAYADEIETLTPLLQQNGPVESVHSSMLELLSSVDIAQQLSIFHTQLFEATDEIELVTQVFGRDQFPGRIPSNLDLLMRRFNEVQFWTTTEVLLAHGPSKRVAHA